MRGGRPPLRVRRSGHVEAEGSLNLGNGGFGWEAALTTTGRISTARWYGSGKQDRKGVREEPATESSSRQPADQNLADQGRAATHTRTAIVVGVTLWSVEVADWEAMVKDCGVAVAMLQGHSWAPTLSNGWKPNVGTIPPVPSPANNKLAGGKVRCRLTPVGWGGRPVVVRGRESRSHGEGVQCVRSRTVDHGGRW